MAMQIPQAEVDYQMAHLDDTRQPGLIAFCTIMLAASILTVVGRFVSRKRHGPGLGPDDWMIAVALILLCGLYVVNCLHIAAGMGRHTLASSKEQQAVAVKLAFLANILYAIAWPAVKISILLLYKRIFFFNHRFTHFLHVFIGILAAYALSTFLVDVFSCDPVDKAWKPTKDGKCIDPIKLYKATASLIAAFDGIIILAPLPLVWRLKASVGMRLAVSGIFLLGGLTFIASIMRLPAFDLINHYDVTWSYVPASYWTAAEICLSVICASLATLRPLWVSTLNSCRSLIRSRSRSTPSTSDQTPNLSDKPPNGQAKGVQMRKLQVSEIVTADRTLRYTSPTREGFEKLSDGGNDYAGGVGRQTRREEMELQVEKKCVASKGKGCPYRKQKGSDAV